MRTATPALIILLAGATCFAGIDPHLKFRGRWDRREPDRAITVNSGSHVLARFEGPAVSATFDVSLNKEPFPTLAWRVDDGEWQEADIAATVKLAEGLPAGEHRLTLMARGLDEHQSRWKPPLTSSLTFLGLDVPGGKWLDVEEPPKPTIEFLGDSITEGVLVHGDRPGKKAWPWKTDGRLAYPSQTAQRLGAEWSQVGFGAQGVTHGGNGGVPAAPDSFAFIDKDCPRNDWQPDMVVINQGTNDGGAPAEKFRPAYHRFLDAIRAGCPKSKIAAMQPFNGAHAADIRAEVEARNAAGDDAVFFVDTTGWLGNGDFTDGLHPNVEGSAKAADKLAAALKGKIAGPATKPTTAGE